MSYWVSSWRKPPSLPSRDDFMKPLRLSVLLYEQVQIITGMIVSLDLSCTHTVPLFSKGSHFSLFMWLGPSRQQPLQISNIMAKCLNRHLGYADTMECLTGNRGRYCDNIDHNFTAFSTNAKVIVPPPGHQTAHIWGGGNVIHTFPTSDTIQILLSTPGKRIHQLRISISPQINHRNISLSRA